MNELGVCDEVKAWDQDPLAQPCAHVVLQALQLAPVPMVLTNTQGAIQHVNAAFEAATGYTLKDLRGRRPSLLKSGLQGDGYYATMWRELLAHGHWTGEVWNRRKNGEIVQEGLSIVALPGEDGQAAFYLGSYSRQMSPSLRHAGKQDAGETDSTTGLLNRSAFLRAVHHLGEQHKLVHVLALDIDGFTELNEQYGLARGDAVLRQMALRCTQVAAVTGSPSVVGRVGPDEFAMGVVMPDQRDSDDAGAVWMDLLAQRLHAAVALPFELESAYKVNIGVTIGLATLTAGQGLAADALLHASSARRQAEPGDFSLQSYERQGAQRRMAHELREAIRLDQIAVAYQPKVDLMTGQLVGVEGLARWTRSDGTAVPPSDFIPQAERLGLIGLLGDRVLERVLADLAAWGRQGLPQPVAAVNFSALQFHSGHPARHVGDALKRHGVPAQLLELELTESLLIGEMDLVMQSLKALRKAGVRLSIDDFGTGYSSLAYLRRFPIQYLKIDRRFVIDMLEDPSALEIVRVIVALAHRLNMRCIAEGIETVEQLALLRKLGCDEGQGYLLAKPMPREALEQILRGEAAWSHLFEAASTGETGFVDLGQGQNMPSHAP